MNWPIVREPTLLTTAAVYGLLAAVAISAGIFGIWLGVLLLISIWRYSYSVLRATAQGRKRIPPPDLDSMNPVGEWALFWHFVALPGAIFATAPYQPLGAVVAIAAAIVFPASAAVMGLTSSLSQAFSPSALLAFVRIVGSDYPALVVGYSAIVAGALVVIGSMVPSAGFLSLALSLAILLWALLASFALVGTVLRAHRLEFEIAGELVPDEDRAHARRHQEWHRVLDIAYAAFRSGLYSSGYKTLHELVDSDGDSIEVNHWLVENMLDWEEKRYALEVAARLMPRLLAGGNDAAALELYHRCRRRDGAFRPDEEAARQLAAYAASVGQTGIVAELVGYNREPL